jgi:hypothetical protein
MADRNPPREQSRKGKRAKARKREAVKSIGPMPKYAREPVERASTRDLPPKLARKIRSESPSLRPVMRKDSQYWYAAGTILGKRYRYSLKTTSLVLAWEKCIADSARIYRERLHGVKPKMGLKQAAPIYIRLKKLSPDAEHKLNRVLGYFPDGTTCDQVDQEMVDAVGDRMLGPHCKHATRMRDVVSPIKALLTFAHSRGWCDRPAFESLPMPDPLKDHLTPLQAERLVASSPQCDADLWVFSSCYGHHISELAKAHRSAVDLHYGRFSISVKSKRGKVVIRRNRIFPRVMPILERLLAIPGRPSHPLFRRADGTPLNAPSGKGAGAYVGRRLERCLRMAGIEIPGKFTHRSFRTTMATWLLSATRGAMKTVKVFGGWRTLRMVDGYSADIDPALVPDILAFYGLPPDTDLVAWLNAAGARPSDSRSR